MSADYVRYITSKLQDLLKFAIKSMIHLKYGDSLVNSAYNLFWDNGLFITDLEINPEIFFTCNIPVTVVSLNVGSIHVDLCNRTFNVIDVNLVLDLTSQVNSNSSEIFEELTHSSESETTSLLGIESVNTFVKDVVDSLIVKCSNVNITILSSLVSRNVTTYTLVAKCETVYYTNKSISLDNVTCFLESFRFLFIPVCSLTIRENSIHLDLMDSFVKTTFTGDIWYVLSTTIENLIMNVQKVWNYIDNNAQEYAMFLSNLNLVCTLKLGSGIQKSVTNHNQFSCRIYNVAGRFVSLKSGFTQIYIETRKIESTVGYIENGISWKMQSDSTGPTWVGNLNVNKMDVEVHQNMVLFLTVLHNFHKVFGEYTILHPEQTGLLFKRVTVSDIEVNFKYIHKAIDYYNQLSGSFKMILSLVPPCNVHFTFPETVLFNNVGFNSLFESYLSHMLSTQKTKCIKKVVKNVILHHLKRLL